jgi:hypothetical protein
MKRTLQEFLKDRKNQYGDLMTDIVESACINEYYDYIKMHVGGCNGKITQKIYDSMTDGQKFHFNKHYNFRGDKIIQDQPKNARLICKIENIEFFTRDVINSKNEKLVFTDNDNYYIDNTENEIKACQRVYNLNYL